MAQLESDETRKVIAQKMVNWLFHEEDLSLSFLEWLKLLSATIIKSNRQFSQYFFDALSQKISSSFADPHLSELKKEIILYNALSYLAFANPQENQVISIKGIDYTIEKIQLTSGWISAPYYAYGSGALTDQNAPSYLIFQGTTTPSDNGFLAGLLADTRPDGAIGAQLYGRGQEKIQQWIDKEYRRTQKRVICTGQSLGGAMSLHAHIHQPNEVDFFVVNPPSLTSREKRMHEKHPCEQCGDPRMLRVVSHTHDPVWSLGSCYFPQRTEVYRYGNNNEGKLVAHARAANCSTHHPEPEFILHEGEPVKNRYWKTLKPFLFIGVFILHVIALPIRIIIQITHEIEELFAKSNSSSAAQETLSSPNDIEQGIASSYSRMKNYNATKGKKDLNPGEKPEHSDTLFSGVSSQPRDDIAKALDAQSSERTSHPRSP